MEKWNEHEIAKIQMHYKQFNVPSDQILKEKEVLENFTEWFNTKFSPDHKFTSEDVADQLLKLRKNGKLPKIRKQEE
jgi:hypothetical protein